MPSAEGNVAEHWQQTTGTKKRFTRTFHRANFGDAAVLTAGGRHARGTLVIFIGNILVIIISILMNLHLFVLEMLETTSIEFYDETQGPAEKATAKYDARTGQRLSHKNMK